MRQSRKHFFFIILFLVLTSIVFSLESKQIPKSNKYQLTNVNLLLDSCWVNRTKNPKLALDYAQKAIKIINKKDLIFLKPKALNYLGVVYRKLGNLDKSYKYFDQALNSALLLKDSIQIGYTYTNLADYYLKKASYSIALENVLIALQIFEKLNDQTGIAYSLNYLGEVYISHGDYEKANTYLEQAADIRLKQNDLRGYSKAILNLGLVQFHLGNYEKARNYYIKSIGINKKIGYHKGNSRALSLMSDINLKRNELKKAKKNIEGALTIDKKINNKAGQIENLNKLGMIELKFKNYKLAYKSLTEAYRMAHESGHLDQEMISHLYLSKYFSATKVYKKAYQYLQKYISLKDSIYSSENLGKFADLQTMFATNKKEVENRILKKEIEFNKRKNTYLTIIFIVTLFIILLLISKYKTQNKANNLLKELNSSKDKFFSILAHDLKNPFQGLLGYTDILKHEYDILTKEEIKESIDSLHNVTRNVYSLLEGLLEWSRAQTGRMEYNPTIFKLSEEAEKVIKLSSENASRKGIILSSDVDDSIKVFADRNMIFTVLRNLVANAIKFSNKDDFVKITAKKRKDDILISVSDSGIGMSQDEVDSLFRIDIHHTTLGTNGEEGTGVGLILCKELVKNNGGNIWAESKPGEGSSFIFTIPINKK